jgi:hypothetical protein
MPTSTRPKYTSKVVEERKGKLPDGWSSKYDRKSGLLKLQVNMSSLAKDFDFTPFAVG